MRVDRPEWRTEFHHGDPVPVHPARMTPEQVSECVRWIVDAATEGWPLTRDDVMFIAILTHWLHENQPGTPKEGL